MHPHSTISGYLFHSNTLNAPLFFFIGGILITGDTARPPAAQLDSYSGPHKSPLSPLMIKLGDMLRQRSFYDDIEKISMKSTDYVGLFIEFLQIYCMIKLKITFQFIVRIIISVSVKNSMNPNLSRLKRLRLKKRNSKQHTI